METAERIADGLWRIALVLRTRAWEKAGARGITPTQGQVLSFVKDAPAPPRLGDVGRSLGIKAPTASKAVSTLVDKGLVAKRADGDDARAVSLHLTRKGRREAEGAAAWPRYLTTVIDLLDDEERAVMLRALVKMIRGLQREGHIPAARTCVDCRHFSPHKYDDAQAPHHCGFVNAPFGDGALQVACDDHDAADEPVANATWRRFLRVVS
jgi:DNA-binding MarR family transcriptional regulator